MTGFRKLVAGLLVALAAVEATRLYVELCRLMDPEGYQ